VAKSEVLVRVKNDLAQGHTYLAIQRLRTLAAVDPADLEVHRMLAAVYRQTGNPVEAGRWAFLTDDLRPDELAAFERANPDPWLRLRLVDWPADPATLPDAMPGTGCSPSAKAPSVPAHRTAGPAPISTRPGAARQSRACSWRSP
jgi:hypothetical protein